MKVQTKLLLAVIALTPVMSTAMAGPPPAKLDPSAATRLPVTPVSEETRRALTPPPAPTGPCMAELSVDRVEISRSGDGATYNVSVTISNIGSEPAVGSQTDAGGVLGIALEVKDLRRTRSYFASAKRRAFVMRSSAPGATQFQSLKLPSRSRTACSVGM